MSTIARRSKISLMPNAADQHAGRLRADEAERRADETERLLLETKEVRL